MTIESLIGRRIPRTDSFEKVRGSEKYTQDIVLPNMLYGAILRSPHPFARITSINLQDALQEKGVVAAITSADFKDVKYVNYGAAYSDRYPLAKEYVRFRGEEVAAVAAETEALARSALEHVEVKYELMPPMFEPSEALRPHARKIHPEDGKNGNLAQDFAASYGDVEEAFKHAAYVVDGTFENGIVWPVCMETNGVVASFNPDSGILEVWATTQAPYFVKKELSNVLGLPLERIHVRSVAVGGGFGGKGQSPEPIAIGALLAIRASRPVKITLSRHEEYISGKTDHAKTMRVQTAVSSHGEILGRKADVIVDNGAYTHMGPVYVASVRQRTACLYRVGTAGVTGRLVYTNKVPGGSYRGMGAPQIIWALETQIDEIAERLQLDPLDYRLKIANRPGDVTPIGWQITTCGMQDCLSRAAELIDWAKKRKERIPFRGIGIAAMIHGSGSVLYAEGNFSNVGLHLRKDGSVEVRTQNADTGTGQNTVLAQIVAEVLQVDMSAVHVVHMDTEKSPVDLGSAASRVTFVTGNAAIAAAQNLLQTIRAALAREVGVQSESISVAKGVFRDSAGRLGALNLTDVAELVGEISVEGHFEIELPALDPKTGYGNYSAAYAFGAQAAEVEVDPNTGHIKVVRVAGVQDVGRVMNRLTLEGQIEGGIVQGIGMALSEEVIFQDGYPVNTSLINYRVPRFEQTPEILLDFVETRDGIGPFGAKAGGEPSINATIAAIANAVSDAVGVRFHKLPITPERVLEALESRRPKKLELHPMDRPYNLEVATVRAAYPAAIFPLLKTTGRLLKSGRAKPGRYDIVRAKNLAEALATLSDSTKPCKIIAGGTDLLVGIRQGIYAPQRLLDLSRVPELRRVTFDCNELRIGAGVTVSELIASEMVRIHVPGLAVGASLIATQPIRNRATVGGDLCQEKRCWFFRSAIPCYRYAGPACPCYAVTNDNRHHSIIGAGRCAAPCVSDFAPMLSALGAQAIVVSRDGQRRIPIEKFYKWAGEPVLKVGELITSIVVPAASCVPGVLVYEKFARWKGDFAEASAAVWVKMAGQEIADCKVALGGVSPHPARASHAEECLIGRRPEDVDIAKAAEHTVRGALPLDKNGYKARLLVGVALKAMTKVLTVSCQTSLLPAK